VVALHRQGELLPAPAPETRLESGDRNGLMGHPDHVRAAETFLRGGKPAE
jgi:K+/H+ antiporter YhaU regulatory subunit KhtT